MSQSNDVCSTLVDLGALDQLKPKLLSALPAIQEKAAMVIGNLATPSSSHRDLVMQYDILPLAIQLCYSPNINVRRCSMWLISNLFRATPAPQIQTARHIILFFFPAILHC
jgi:hypothetical protein